MTSSSERSAMPSYLTGATTPADAAAMLAAMVRTVEERMMKVVGYDYALS